MILFSSFSTYKTIPIRSLPLSLVPNPVKSWKFGYYEKLFPSEELIRSINFRVLDGSRFPELYRESVLSVLNVHEIILDLYERINDSDYVAIALVDYGEPHKVRPAKELYDWFSSAGYAVAKWK